MWCWVLAKREEMYSFLSGLKCICENDLFPQNSTQNSHQKLKKNALLGWRSKSVSVLVCLVRVLFVMTSDKLISRIKQLLNIQKCPENVWTFDNFEVKHRKRFRPACLDCNCENKNIDKNNKNKITSLTYIGFVSEYLQ